MKLPIIILNTVTTLCSQDLTPFCTDSEKQDVSLCQTPWEIFPGVHKLHWEHILECIEKWGTCVKKRFVNLGWWLNQVQTKAICSYWTTVTLSQMITYWECSYCPGLNICTIWTVDNDHTWPLKSSFLLVEGPNIDLVLTCTTGLQYNTRTAVTAMPIKILRK